MLILADAAGLISRLLEVDPAKRANILDVAAHWWTNHEQEDLLASAELSEKRTSDYFEEEDPERISTVFDSTKKPKKGILKHRRMSGGDSGCALSDAKESEISLSKLESALDDVILNSSNSKTKSVKTVTLREDSTSSSKRHSLSSNSSTDMLDFCYDSSSNHLDLLPVCEV